MVEVDEFMVEFNVDVDDFNYGNGVYIHIKFDHKFINFDHG
jgi:hypothetical protein